MANDPARRKVFRDDAMPWLEARPFRKKTQLLDLAFAQRVADICELGAKTSAGIKIKFPHKPDVFAFRAQLYAVRLAARQLRRDAYPAVSTVEFRLYKEGKFYWLELLSKEQFIARFGIYDRGTNHLLWPGGEPEDVEGLKELEGLEIAK